MRFQLPQFIETEIKLVGPLTLKQFLWVAGGTAIIFLLFLISHGILFFALALPTAMIFLGLAFIKIDGEPLLNYFAYGLTYLLRPKKYVFKQNPAQNDVNKLLELEKPSPTEETPADTNAPTK